MLDTLKFVGGAVAKKTFLPALTHFKIRVGRVTGYNGSLAISAPLPLDLECQPDARALTAAIGQCKAAVTLTLTDAGRLRVSSGKFRALVSCHVEDIPILEPAGEVMDLDGETLIKGLKILDGFIGTDAARPWCNGVLMRGRSAFATNNVCLIEYWIGLQMPFDMNIPDVCVQELLRVDVAPNRMQTDGRSIAFHYEDGSWICASLLSVSDWPDLSRVLDRPANPTPVHPELFQAAVTVAPFADELDRLYFHAGRVSTVPEGQEGADYTLEGFEFSGIYPIPMIKLLDGVAEKIDFTSYPAPCIFHGNQLRGAIVGYRQPTVEE